MIYLVGVDARFQYVNESSEHHPEELRDILNAFLEETEIDLVAEDFEDEYREELEVTEVVGQTVALDHSIPHRYISPDPSECDEYDILPHAELQEQKEMFGWSGREYEDALADNDGRREEFIMEAVRNDLNEEKNVLLICPDRNVEGLCDLLEEDSYEYEIVDELTDDE